MTNDTTPANGLPATVAESAPEPTVRKAKRVVTDHAAQAAAREAITSRSKPSRPTGKTSATKVTDANTCSPLTPDEEEALSVCEDALRRYETASLDAGYALRTIREAELYRSTHKDFKAYVKATWKTIGVRRAQQLIAAVDVVDEMDAEGHEVLPANESQARHLAGLPADDRARVWDAVLAAPGRPSGAKVLRAVKALLTEPTSTAHWPADARRALRAIAKAHRPAVTARANAFGEDVTAAMVADLVEGYKAAVLEDGEGATDAVVVGEAVDLVAAQEAEPDAPEGTSETPIDDLVVLGEEAVVKRHSAFVRSDEKRPLLVALPTGLVPARLVADVPAGVSQVVAEVGELERLGGPVRAEKLMLDEVRDYCKEHRLFPEMQRTTESVDWARFTSNMLTGCWHGCRHEFCYAAGIARRLFAQGFLPTLYPARLGHLANTRVPDVSGLSREEAWRERSVFMVSMGDLFGTWVPEYYVKAVLKEVKRRDKWFCFFLTKHPKGLDRFTFPPNCAVGLTLTGDEPYGTGTYSPEDRAELYAKYGQQLAEVKGAAFTWLSIEPFRGDVGDLSPFFDAGVAMVAIGGQSATTLLGRDGRLVHSPARQPELSWADSVRRQVREAGVMLFEKENLLVRPKEIPFPVGLPGATAHL